MRKLKTWTSHTGAAQFYAEASDEPIGYIPRQAQIPSPYRYSPSDSVYLWRGVRVIFREVAHRRYQAFELPAEMTLCATDDAAADLYLGPPCSLPR